MNLFFLLAFNYYMCTRGKGVECKNPAINEKDLIGELSDLLDTVDVDVDEIGMRSKIEDEIARFNRFRTGVLGVKTKERNVDVDVRSYAKYLLRDGTLTEKRELLACLKSRLVLKDRKISLDKPALYRLWVRFIVATAFNAKVYSGTMTQCDDIFFPRSACYCYLLSVYSRSLPT